MSEFDLSVGDSYDIRRTQLCISHLRNLGLSSKASDWGLETRQPIKKFFLLNLGTVVMFTDYVAKLVGRPTRLLMRDDAFENLPYWQDTLWAPVAFTPGKAFENDQAGPFYFGSSPRLLETLNYIKSISRIPLGPVPQQYDLMVTDFRAFYKNFRDLDSEQSCIQWVWRGLYDAATLAVQSKSPMLGNGL